VFVNSRLASLLHLNNVILLVFYSSIRNSLRIYITQDVVLPDT